MSKPDVLSDLNYDCDVAFAVVRNMTENCYYNLTNASLMFL